MKIGYYFVMLVTVGLTHSISLAQNVENRNPYAIFGSTPYMVGVSDKKLTVLSIENLAEGSMIVRLKHNPETGYITYFDKEGNVVDHKKLKLGTRAWPTQDPHALKYASWSPYAYCANNPAMIIDPTGMDWVRDTSGGGLGRFVWMDDVTSPDNTPNGYIYVGQSNGDLLDALNVMAQYPAQSSYGRGIFMDNQGNANILGYDQMQVIGRLGIEPVIKYDKNKISDNNQFGKTYIGVNVRGSYMGPRSPNNYEVGGKLDIYLGIESVYTSELLMRYNEPHFALPGTVHYEGVAFIPAEALEFSYLSTATINVGGYMSAIHIYYKNPSVSWHLQTRQTFRQGVIK